MSKNTWMCYDGPSIFGKNFYSLIKCLMLYSQLIWHPSWHFLLKPISISMKDLCWTQLSPPCTSFNTQTTLIFHLQKPYFWDCCPPKRKWQNELFSLVIVYKHCEIWKNAATHAKPVLIISMNCIGNIHMVVACM